MIAYYEVIFILSIILFIPFLVKLKKNHNVSLAFLFMLIALSEGGALMRSVATTLEGAIWGNNMSYIGGCFLQVAVTFLILDLCRISAPKIVEMLMLFPGVFFYIMVWTDSYTHFFYKTVSLSNWHGITVLEKEYGIGHTLFYVMLVAYFIVNLALLIYGAVKKKDASVKNIFILTALETASLFVYFLQKFFPSGIQLTAAVYLLSQMTFLIIMDRIALYDIDNTVIDALMKSGDLGCFSFNLKMGYLGCNHVAKSWFPQLDLLRVDMGLPHDNNDEFFEQIRMWISKIDETHEKQEFIYSANQRQYKVTGGYLFNGNKSIGYQFSLSDCTQEQKYIELLNSYKEELERDVTIKTAHIREMHQRLVLGMADMVESRDNSTGGHIKRTSQIVRIIIEEIQKDPNVTMAPQYCAAVIKAAPMHDLGKIAVDDEILRKPGKYTPEEYAIMKTHAKEGAVIVRKLLQNLDDDYFAQIAENVAHYHHERMDGTGYPEGLKGEEIPLEARIMAIADVYDALVSKRCYKDSMSCEEAFRIIEEGMGTQFDERLNPYFIASKDKLEAFYNQELQND